MAAALTFSDVRGKSSTATSPFRLGHSPGLDGLRAISIALVFTDHIHQMVPALPQILIGGFLGVDVFFVVSGFLITSLLLEERERFGSVNLRQFYFRRALRLLPALFGILLVTCALGLFLGSLATVNLSPFRLLSIVAYFMNWIRAFEIPQSWFLGHFWSLSVEEQFYSAWPISLLILLRLRSRKSLMMIVMVAAGISCALKAFLFLHGAPLQRIIFGSDTRAEPILIGCLLALVLHWGCAPSVLKSNRVLALALVVGGLLVGFTNNQFAVTYLGGLSLFGLCVAVVIHKIVTEPLSNFSRRLSTRPLVWIGKRSYGIYLWHWPALKLSRAVSIDPLIFVPVAV